MSNSAKTISNTDGKKYLQQSFSKQQELLKTQLEAIAGSGKVVDC